MKLPWRQPPAPATAEAGREPSEAFPCPTLARALEALARVERPAVLDLGPMCGETVVYLADHGARVSVGELDLPQPLPAADAAASSPVVRFKIDHPDGAFALVLAWEWFDFVPPDRMDEFVGELRRVLSADGWLLLFSLNREAAVPARPSRFRVQPDGRVLREAGEGDPRRRWHYPTRRIESLLAPLEVQKLHLQRDQMREFLAHKPRPRVEGGT